MIGGEYVMNVPDVCRLIEEKWDELGNSANLNFKDYLMSGSWRAKKGILEYIGVYVIYRDNAPIYVGHAGKGEHFLKYRIGDLFGYSPNAKRNHFYHSLTRKLVKKLMLQNEVETESEALEKVREFLSEKCTFRIIRTNTVDEARVLEQTFILLLNHPEYNG